MGRGMLATGGLNNLEQFRQFGGTAGNLANQYDLFPAQRTFFLRSNQNLLEQMRKWYGGRPLTVESYFGGIQSLMKSLQGAGLPMAGAPIAMDVAKSLGAALSPIGKRPPW